ncbi:neurogenic locus notch homolog protein 1-like [Ischnura elegans]|uniref:neurogenic locus notch homolog protein 1-like n=1 Tax=Ischnura elegans TaxID=197161 RepID=UPI001ED87004|nr:neurogenic locus notch homolog protein 1-like [Ischnura elegans]
MFFAHLILFLLTHLSVNADLVRDIRCTVDGDCPANAYCYKGNYTCMWQLSSMLATNLTTRKALVGQDCTSNDDCIEDAYCYTGWDNYVCECQRGLRKNSDGSKCLSSGLVGKLCTEDSDCGWGERCADDGKCGCDASHALPAPPNNESCKALLQERCDSDGDCFNKYAYCEVGYSCECINGYEIQYGSCRGAYFSRCDNNRDCADPAAVCRLVSGGFRCVCRDGYHFDEEKGACNSGSCSLDISTLRIFLLLSMAVLTKSFSSF